MQPSCTLFLVDNLQISMKYEYHNIIKRKYHNNIPRRQSGVYKGMEDVLYECETVTTQLLGQLEQGLEKTSPGIYISSSYFKYSKINYSVVLHSCLIRRIYLNILDVSYGFKFDQTHRVADPPENCHLTVKKIAKKLTFFQKIAKNFHFFQKNCHWQFF